MDMHRYMIDHQDKTEELVSTVSVTNSTTVCDMFVKWLQQAEPCLHLTLIFILTIQHKNLTFIT